MLMCMYMYTWLCSGIGSLHEIWWLNFGHQTCYKHRAVERLEKHSLTTCFLTWGFHSIRYVQYISVSVRVCVRVSVCARAHTFHLWGSVLVVRHCTCLKVFLRFRSSGENVSGHLVNSKKETKCPTTTQNSLLESVCSAIVYVLLLLLIHLSELASRQAFPLHKAVQWDGSVACTLTNPEYCQAILSFIIWY